MLLPHIQRYADDESLNKSEDHAGLYIRAEEDQLIVEPVSGSERPDLCYGRITEDGNITEEAGRYYADDLNTEEKLISALKELDSRPKSLKMGEDNESGDWPPKLLEEYQCGRLLLNGRLSQIRLGNRFIPVQFRRKDFLWQHPLKRSVERIYISIDTLLNLPEKQCPIFLMSFVG